MRENDIGLILRLVGTLYASYKLAELLNYLPQEFGKTETWYTILVSMLSGMIFILFMWMGAESDDKKEKK